MRSNASEESGGARDGAGSSDLEHMFSAATLTRLAAATRLVSCFAALYIALLSSRPAQHPPTLLMPLLVLFAVYCGALYWRAVQVRVTPPGQWIQWLDACWILAFVALSGGPRSVFSLFLLFPVLFVSIRHGFLPGMAMTAVLSVLLLGIGVALSGLMPRALAEMLLPSCALLVLGYLIATWAASGLAMSRRLAFLKEVNALFNPRLGIDQMVDLAVRRLTSIYRIDRYALVVSGPDDAPRAFQARLPHAMSKLHGADAADLSRLLIGMELGEPIAWRRRLRARAGRLLLASGGRASGTPACDAAARIAGLLACPAFCAIEIRLRQGVAARLVLCSRHMAFGLDDLGFLRQLGEQISHPIESVQLLDGLAREVAEHERQKISRDLHDSAIQPYIGFKFALEALARRVEPSDPVAADIRRLAELAGSEIVELRRYVKELRNKSEAGRAALLPALRRQARRFGELYGVQVEVVAQGTVQVGDELADEAYHIVAEALANIRRHTDAPAARIELSCTAADFILRVTNPADQQRGATRAFRPKSIAERAHALGGTCRVEFGAQGETAVIVDVPLQAVRGVATNVRQLAQAARTVLHAA